jgi:hypothetical protein
MVGVLMAGSPAMWTAYHRLVEREQMSPPTGHRHYLGVFLLYISAFLGLLLRRDADLYPLTGLGFLFLMWQLC